MKLMVLILLLLLMLDDLCKSLLNSDFIEKVIAGVAKFGQMCSVQVAVA